MCDELANVPVFHGFAPFCFGFSMLKGYCWGLGDGSLYQKY
jgi:hypothetical protein